MATKKIALLAVVFNSRSEDLGGFVEVVRDTAVDRTLREGRDVLALLNHDQNLVLGRVSNGTTVLKKLSRGLEAEIAPPDTHAARDVVTLIQRQDIQGGSFSFSVPKNGDRWSVADDGAILRELLDMSIYDVAPVSTPAYPATTVGLRSAVSSPVAPDVAADLARRRRRLVLIEARSKERAWLRDADGEPVNRSEARRRGVKFLEAVEARFGSTSAVPRGLTWNGESGWSDGRSTPAPPMSSADRRRRLEQLRRELGR